MWPAIRSAHARPGASFRFSKPPRSSCTPQWVESRRGYDIKNPGSMDQDPIFSNFKLPAHEVGAAAGMGRVERRAGARKASSRLLLQAAPQ